MNDTVHRVLDGRGGFKHRIKDPFFFLYRGIEEYIFHILCKNPQRPVPLRTIVTYVNLIDASIADVQFVIDRLERKRIITRTPQGIVMRLYF